MKDESTFGHSYPKLHKSDKNHNTIRATTASSIARILPSWSCSNTSSPLALSSFHPHIYSLSACRDWVFSQWLHQTKVGSDIGFPYTSMLFKHRTYFITSNIEKWNKRLHLISIIKRVEL